MDVLQFVSTVVGQAVLLAAAAWLIRKLFENSFRRDADRFKAELQRDGDAFRSALERESDRDKTTFSKLHEDRARKIEEVYRLLVIAEREVRSMVAPFQLAGEPPQDDKAKASYAALTDLQVSFERMKIWFTEATCKKADTAIEELRSIHNFFNIVVMGRAAGRAAEPDAQRWGETWERFEKKVPPFKAALEADFRELLGVTQKGPA